MNYKVNNAGTVAVAADVHWQPIDAGTPRGVKLLVINRAANVASLGVVTSNNQHWTHWAPLPAWRVEGV